MAFLVCFKKTDNEDCWHDKAIYLDYEFYNLIFYRQDSCDSLLNKLSNLDYNGTLEIEQSQLDHLRTELVRLTSDSSHWQVKSFISIVDKALQSKWSLTIAGDMYPVLT